VRRLPLFLITLASLVSLAACADRLDVPFSIGDTDAVAIVHENTLENGRTGESVATSEYVLARDTEVPPTAQDFAIRPIDGAVLRTARIEGRDGQILGERDFSDFAQLEDQREYRIVLPAGASVTGFSLSYVAETEKAPFSYVGFRDHAAGLSVQEERVIVGAGALSASGQLRAPALEQAPPSGRHVRIAFREPPSADPRFLSLAYTLAPPTGDADAAPATDRAGRLPTASVSVSCGSAASTRDFQLTLRPGRHAVYLHDAVLGCTPTTVELTGVPGRAQVEEILFGTVNSAEHAPIPSDLGLVGSYYPRSAWRQSDYELFAWNLYPSILIFDMRSYEVQSRFFKRLAFFVEKRGFRGEMLSDAELAARHGWNAHNYRPEDLAGFYNVADVEGLALNAEERLLREILLANGVLRRGGNKELTAGRGGILSVSQESHPVLRELLLSHEAYHGVFYANRAFRSGVNAQWELLSEAEREFWRRMLSYLTYDPNDSYLMVNEFQAYLLQQGVDRARGYLRGTVARRFSARRGDNYVEAFLAEHPRTFERAAQRMDALLFQTAGLVAGDVFCLR
jgi:hypothetical protein